MTDRNRTRLRFSIKTLMAVVTFVALSLGGWIAWSKYKLQQLTVLRQQGTIIIIRDRTPRALQAIGIKQLHPFYSVPTVELYVTPKGADALVGNSEQVISNADARNNLLHQAAIARGYGATDIQLILIDSFDGEWTNFAFANSMALIGDSKQRYMARLKANQETGANINP